jgi:hypothetical protein
MQLTWKGFLPWLESNHSDDVVHLDDTLRVVNGLCKDISQAAVREMRANQSCVHIFKAVWCLHVLPEKGERILLSLLDRISFTF